MQRQWSCLDSPDGVAFSCCKPAGYGQMASLVCSWISKTDQDAETSTSEQADEVTHMQVPPAPALSRHVHLLTSQQAAQSSLSPSCICCVSIISYDINNLLPNQGR